MIFAAILTAIAVFLIILYFLSLVTGSKTLGEDKSISERIFQVVDPDQDTTKKIKKKPFKIEWLENILGDYELAQRINKNIRRAGYALSASTFLLGLGIFSLLTFIFLCPITGYAMAVGISFLTLIFPFIFLKIRNRMYVNKFVELFPNALSVISNSIKVGQSLETGITAVTRSNLYPVSEEFKMIQKQLQLGQTLPESLKNFYKAFPIPEVKIFTTGVIIHQELGGNLSEILETLEQTIRSRFALRREINVLSAQGVMSSRVLMLIPFAAAGIWNTADPDMMTNWAQTTTGKMGITYCVIAMIVAYLLMKKAINIKD